MIKTTNIKTGARFSRTFSATEEGFTMVCFDDSDLGTSNQENFVFKLWAFS